MSKMFGREFRERQSQTLSDDNESIQLSFSEEELMPVNRRFMKKMRNNALGLLTGSSRMPHRKLFCRWMTSTSRDSTLSYDK